MSRVEPAERPGVLASTVFAQEAVIMLRESDFTLSDQIPIGIYDTSCILVLFYAENVESRQLAEIWWLVAQQVAGPTFAACNLKLEEQVAKAFTSLNLINGPLHWAAMKGIPFILVYQNGLPIGFYNGERAVEPIADYALTLACSAGYREQIQLAGGESIKNNYEMPGYTEYTPERTQSIEYKTGAPIRKFDTRGQIQLAGTRGAETEATREEEQEEAAGETPSAAPESPETTETTGASETPTVTPSSEELLVPTRGSVEEAPVEETTAGEPEEETTPVEETAGEVPEETEEAGETLVPTAGEVA
uniref:Thioredoxin-like protein n=1 Tax=Pithovirus LCPAC103 TaxID=2506588 RepID=A0A481Z465_9VIRU|nr:MAG: thioredoxin-like protein [Pithovirus LCPAC103]